MSKFIDTGECLLNVGQVSVIEYDAKRLSFRLSDGEWRYWSSPELEGVSDGHARLYWGLSCLLQAWPPEVGDVCDLHGMAHEVLKGVKDDGPE